MNLPPVPHLQLPEADEYGSRPAVAEEALAAYLASAGLLPLRCYANAAPPSLRWLREQAARHNTPVLLSLLGKEAPDLVPHLLGNAVVWYFALPESMHPQIARIKQSKLSCYGGLTGDPWVNSTFLCLSTGLNVERGGPPGLSFRPPGTSVDDAADLGFVVALFDCAGELHGRGFAVGEEIIFGLAGCDASSFQRPLRCYPLRALQERTRAVEETGMDPDGPPSNGNLVLPVLSSSATASRPYEIPAHLRRSLPPVQWNGMGSGVIGWLPAVTHFPEECPGDTHLVLKVTVVSQVYDQIVDGRGSASVHRVSLHQKAGNGYVLLLEAGDSVCIVAMSACDPRFRDVYDYWSRVGSCQIAVENFRNGRLHRIRQAWPHAFKAEVGQAGVEEDGGHPPIRLHDDSAIRALVLNRAKSMERRLTCYLCDLVDQSQWEAEGN